MYKYRKDEIAEMKKAIQTSIQSETTPTQSGKITAWRLRLACATIADCSNTKRSRAWGTRKLTLYESLTKDDIPNWNDENP